ncbi:hypothetical protein ACIBHY_45810 [Nonomuraea sp. NPDC050547]
MVVRLPGGTVMSGGVDDLESAAAALPPPVTWRASPAGVSVVRAYPGEKE